MTSESALWLTKYRRDNFTYGPLPTYIDVTADGNVPKYNVTINKELKTFSHHPLSPSGRQEWGDLLARAPEEKGKKADCAGVAHPSFVYKPSEWLWETYDDRKDILIKALELTGVTVTHEAFANEKNAKAVQELMSNRAQLYHPRDRDDLSPFYDEHWCSCWARFFGRGLYVVGPEISKNGKDWASFQNAIAAKRNAIRARHSTGDQDDARPIILGCLPGSATSNKWFVLVPTKATIKDFQNIWSSCDWANEARRFNYTDTEKFIWAIVSIQRSIVLRSIKDLRDEDLGEAITQYGVYIEDKDGLPSRAYFNFKKPTTKSAPMITFHDITRWIVTADKNSSAKRWAKAWDEATQHVAAYQLSLDWLDWNKFLGSAADVRLKK